MKKAISAIAIVSLLAYTLPVSSQDLAILEEVVVTSRRVEENVQKAPITVSVLSSNMIENALITNITEIDAMIPNVNVAPVNFFTGDISPFIRGIGTFEQEMTFDPAVSVVIDGIYLARTSGAMPDLFDIERIEILRGPQGTVFGRNSLAGALNIVTRRPEEEFGLRASATIGEYGQEDFAARVDVPLTDKLLTKVSIQRVKNDGYFDLVLNDGSATWDQLAGLLGLPNGDTLVGLLPPAEEGGPNQLSGNVGDFGGVDNLSVRPVITYRFSEDSEISILGEYARLEAEPRGINSTPLGTVSLPDGTPLPSPDLDLFGGGTYALSTIFPNAGGVGLDLSDLGEEAYDIEYNLESKYKIDIEGLYLEGIFGIGDGELIANGGYRELDRDINFDADGSAIDWFNVARPEHYEQTTLDVRYNAPLPWGYDSQYLVGVFYLEDEAQQKDRFYGGAITVNALLAGQGFVYESFGGIAQDRESYALYTTLDYSFNEKWRATVGARYSYEEKKFTYIENGLCQNLQLTFADCGAPGASVVKIDDNWDNISAKFTLDYQANDNVLIYGIIATAFRSGGFNGRAPTRQDLGPFDEEEVLSYELGLKSELAERRVRLNAAVFYNEYDDLQREFQLGNGRTVNQNAADGDIFGIELELTAIPIESLPDLSVRATYGYLDFQYGTYAGDLNGDGAIEDVSGNALPRAPENTYSAEVLYMHDIGPGSVHTRAAYSWQDESFISNQNFDELKTESYGLLEASLGYFWNLENGNKVRITAFGKNLTDETVAINGSAVVGNIQPADVNAPRRYGVRLEYDY